MLTRCSECGVDKHRIKETRSRIFKGKEVFCFRDDKGKLWSQFRCPECKDGPSGEGGFVADPKTKRRCRRCSKPLPASRYFHHTVCVNNLSDTFGPEEWGGAVRSLPEFESPLVRW